MKRLMIVAALCLLAAPQGPAFGQTMNARRTGMGGVVLPSGGPGSDAYNAAYRAVPQARGTSATIGLPLGLIPLISNPPSLDMDDPDFNIYELANTLYNPPFHLQLIEPEAPSNDVVVAIGKSHLSVELGEISRLFPEDHSRIGTIGSLPALGFGFRDYYVTASALAQYDNDLGFNSELHGVLAEGKSFATNTNYAMTDDAVGQVAAMLEFGWAATLKSQGQPRVSGGSGIYAGARTKVLRGLAYGDTRNTVSFSTGDTLFADYPIELEYAGAMRRAGPGGGGLGYGLDLGVVWITDDYEIGVGVNDLVSRLNWRVEESIAYRYEENEEFVREVTAENVPFTSHLPKRGTVNGSVRLAGTVVAADLVRTMGRTLAHAGAENWQGPVALRAGCGVDANRSLQVSGGLGFRIGRFGIDTAVATHSRNLTRERGVELAAGLALYR